MGFFGTNPKVNFINAAPQSADPSNPQEGDIFNSDGTPRDAGLWIYQAGNWEQFSTGAVLSVLNNLTLTPQASDPGSPAEGMIFRADGTSRAEGIWEYRNGSWSQISGQRYQEFFHKQIIEVRAASTSNNPLSSGVYQAGGTLDGVVLVANDTILIKSQTTQSDNGVYTVNTGVAPTRTSGIDTAAALTNAVVYVSEGTANKYTFFYQNETLNTLFDNQTWATSPNDFTFTVPAGVDELSILACGAGGGGGGGFTSNSLVSSAAGGAGGAGQGSLPILTKILVSPLEVLTISIGIHGKKGIAGANPNSTIIARGSFTTQGTSGGNTTISGSFGTLTIPGGAGGAATGGSSGGAGTASALVPAYVPAYVVGGAAGRDRQSVSGVAGISGSSTTSASGGAGGAGGNVVSSRWAGGAGGGGGAGLGDGGIGGNGGNGGSTQTINFQSPCSQNAPNPTGTNYGAGGGSGGGGGQPSALVDGNGIAGHGAHGGSGYVRFSW